LGDYLVGGSGEFLDGTALSLFTRREGTNYQAHMLGTPNCRLGAENHMLRQTEVRQNSSQLTIALQFWNTCCKPLTNGLPIYSNLKARETRMMGGLSIHIEISLSNEPPKFISRHLIVPQRQRRVIRSKHFAGAFSNLLELTTRAFTAPSKEAFHDQAHNPSHFG
jgi:hypothetical protein